MQKLMKQQPGTIQVAAWLMVAVQSVDTPSALKTVNSVLYVLQVYLWKQKFQHPCSIPPTKRPSLPPPAPLDRSHSYSYLNRLFMEACTQVDVGDDAVVVCVCRRVLHHRSAPG